MLLSNITVKITLFTCVWIALGCQNIKVTTKSYGSRESLNMRKKKLKVIGWREWLSLPDLGVKKIKVKVDTGARTSSLHAFDIETYKRDGKEYIKFKVHPFQRDSEKIVNCRARIREYRKVKSSNGISELRPVILTKIQLLEEEWPVEITLTNRAEMGFRMLLGRASIRDKFLVDTGKSFYSKKKNKKKGVL